MAEPSYTHHLIVLHPTEAKALLVGGEGGWRLPKFSPKDGFFALTEEVNRFMRTTFGLEGVVLRPVNRWETENHTDTLYLCEAYAVLEGRGGQWLGLERLKAAPFEKPDHKPFALTALAEDIGLEAISEERPDWARRDWWRGAETWLKEELARLGYGGVGALKQTKQWGISSVGRITTASGPLYFKAPPPIFAHEAEVTLALARLFPHNLPQVLTLHPEAGWFVTADFGANQPDKAARKVAIRRLAEMQIEVLPHLAMLRESGCEARPLAALGEEFDALLEHPRVTTGLAQDLALLHESRSTVKSMISDLAACGVPETLMHGDFHYGNVVVRGDDCIIFDWTDACITHPFLDAAHVVSYYKEAEKGELVASYLEPWRRAFPTAQLARAFGLAGLLMPIFFAQTYRRIVASLEPGSKWEFGGEAENYLGKLAATLRNGLEVD